MMTILSIIGYIIFLLFFHEVMRRSKYLFFTFIFIAPLFLTPYWLNFPHTVFSWIKIYTVIFSCAWLYLCRFTSLGNKKWALYFIGVLLFINIAEPTVTDYLHNHWINSIAGLLLLLNLIVIGAKTISIENDKYRNLIWGNLPLIWIIGFCIWQIVFIYNNFTQDLWVHAALSSSALIVALYRAELWPQARVITLYIFLFNRYTYKPMLEFLNSSVMYSENISYILSAVSVLYMIGLTVYVFYKKYKTSKIVTSQGEPR